MAMPIIVANSSFAGFGKISESEIERRLSPRAIKTTGPRTAPMNRCGIGLLNLINLKMTAKRTRIRSAEELGRVNRSTIPPMAPTIIKFRQGNPLPKRFKEA